MHVYDLPYRCREQLVTVLDINADWEDVAALLGFPAQEVYFLRQAGSRGNTPSKEMLQIVSAKGFTVDAFRQVLVAAGNIRAADLLLPFVVADRGSVECNGNVEKVVKGSGERILHKHQPKASVFPSRRQCNKALRQSHNEGVSPSAHPLNCILNLPGALRANYEEIREATDNFEYSNVLGHGGYGIVYRGKWKNTTVAVKKVMFHEKKQNEDCIAQLVKELQVLSLYRHDNILSLYGYCLEGTALCLIYQFMANGSLDERLHNKTLKALTWPERWSVLTGACRGLNFLHTCTEQPLIHGDVKSANILLDQHLEAKIGDFGLCRSGGRLDEGEEQGFIASHIKGTFAYLPPEFITKKRVSSKLDVYSFGTVLFEVATGLRPHVIGRNPENLVQYMRHQRFTKDSMSHLMDNRACGKRTHMFDLFLSLAFDCTNVQPEDRPGMCEVLRKLEQKPAGDNAAESDDNAEPDDSESNR